MVLKPGRGKAIRCDDVRWTCWEITTEDTEYTEKGMLGKGKGEISG